MIVDSHHDIAWNALAEGRGFTSDPRPGFMVTRKALTNAGVGLVFSTIFTAPRSARVMAGLPYTYATAREAYLLGRAQLSYYESVDLRLLLTREALTGYVRDWRPGQLAAILLMENADPIESPSQVGEWVRRGLRVVGPAWARTRYCGGTHAPGGLTDAGRMLLAAMRRHKLILDLSHMADRSMRDSLEMWTGPVVATHGGARTVNPRQRQLPDSVIAEVGRRNGMMGISLFSGHLTRQPPATIEDVVDHAAHVATVTGTTQCIGLGSDLDGGFGSDLAAIGSLAELRQLQSALGRRLGRPAAEGIMGGNWIRFLEAALPSERTVVRASAE
ncbi:MAG: membrane dipeptidase [Candidatus Dormibacteraeota bacterium]|uniref:Membrane dipeptidase n=1 Tax=Candidatus Amunia macphersoniae TaxID=3127014 RepID=A0A934KFC5_9BACT|nr:membrane dipeptidase [Candidatus Dormibacteraeota bacterium]